MLWYYAVVLAVIGAAFVGYRLWVKRVEEDITVGAAAAYAQMQANEPAFMEGLTPEKFRDIYRRVHFPRFPGYAVACMATFLVATPPILGVLSGLLYVADRLGFVAAPIDIAERYFIEGDRVRIFTAAPPEVAIYYAQDLSGFYYFFGLAIAWVIIVFLFMRRFHAGRPGYIRDEIIRAR